MLTREKRLRARAIARQSWIDSGHDKNKAIELARQQAEAEFGPAEILIILRLILALIEWWYSRGEKNPPVSPAIDEPTGESD